MSLSITEKPSRPRGPLKATDIQKTSLTVQWKNPEDDGGSPLTGYLLEMRETNRQYWNRVDQVSASITNYIVQNLRQDIEYEFRVTAMNKIGQSEPLVSEGSYMTKSPFSKHLIIFALLLRSVFSNINLENV